MYYSQLGEDREIYETYIKPNLDKLPDGKYIEIGAIDGLRYSNTKFFEETLGWTGVLVEASPKTFHHLKKNRPNDQCFNYAVADQVGEIEFIGHNAVGGIVDRLHDEPKEMWHQESESYMTPVAPFKSFVTPDVIPYVDFFSCDVEGSEYGVLSTFDWRIPVWLVLVEMMDKLYQEENDKCRAYLAEQGFEPHGRVGGLNELWINPNYPRITGRKGFFHSLLPDGLARTLKLG